MAENNETVEKAKVKPAAKKIYDPFDLSEKELFAMEVLKRGHPHNDWIIGYKSIGVGDVYYLICGKCKLIRDFTDYGTW